MPYEYLDHTADLGIRATGATPEEAFAAGAQAMLDAMADTSSVQPRQRFEQRCSAPDMATLFVEWLNELLYQREVGDALFASARVDRVWKDGDRWALEAVAFGEPLDQARHQVHAEIKGATYFGLDYQCSPHECSVQCVLDV